MSEFALEEIAAERAAPETAAPDGRGGRTFGALPAPTQPAGRVQPRLAGHHHRRRHRRPWLAPYEPTFTKLERDQRPPFTPVTRWVATPRAATSCPG